MAWWFGPVLSTIFVAFLIILIFARLIEGLGFKSNVIKILIVISYSITTLIAIFFSICLVVYAWIEAIPK